MKSVMTETNTLLGDFAALTDKGQDTFKENIEISHKMLNPTNLASYIIAPLKNRLR
jgi:hypothetical protein